MVMVSEKNFGVLEDKEIFLYTLKSEQLEVELINYGASVRSIKLKDSADKIVDVVLGYGSLESYIYSDKLLGATVGRVANRIRNGVFILGNEYIHLSKNSPNGHIHGGFEGFNKKVWQAEIIANGVRFLYTSLDGEEGYPGKLKTSVTYRIQNNSLHIEYSAVSDKDTVFSPTNHTYFNLDGEGDILEQYVKINSDFYTENDYSSTPNGNIREVSGTPMDFREFKQIGKDISSNFEQIQFGKGYDNNWVVKNYDAKIKLVASAYSKKNGIYMDVSSDFPGVQFYTGNYLDSEFVGKNNSRIDFRSGFCLECQYFPNSFEYSNFIKPILKKDDVFNKNIIYSFKVVQKENFKV